MRVTRETVMEWLREASSKGAHELHLKVPNSPLLRTGAGLLPSREPPLTPADTQAAASWLLQLAKVELGLAQVTDHEFSFGVSGLGRFRVSLYRQRGSLAVILRPMRFDIPRVEAFELSENGVGEMLSTPGLVLVCGPNREEVFASLIGSYNRSFQRHAVVLEHQLVFLHRDKQAAISQREVGVDVESYDAGIRSALRQRAELIAVGDVFDQRTAEAVLTASERGLTVLASVAAPEAKLAPEWLVRTYEPERFKVEQRRVKMVLTAVVEAGQNGIARIARTRTEPQGAQV